MQRHSRAQIAKGGDQLKRPSSGGLLAAPCHNAESFANADAPPVFLFADSAK